MWFFSDPDAEMKSCGNLAGKAHFNVCALFPGTDFMLIWHAIPSWMGLGKPPKIAREKHDHRHLKLLPLSGCHGDDACGEDETAVHMSPSPSPQSEIHSSEEGDQKHGSLWKRDSVIHSGIAETRTTDSLITCSCFHYPDFDIPCENQPNIAQAVQELQKEHSDTEDRSPTVTELACGAREKHVHSQSSTTALANRPQDVNVSLSGRESQVETGSATMTTDLPVEQSTAREEHVHSQPATAALANRAQDIHVSIGGRENQVETGSATMTTDLPVEQSTAREEHVHSQPATAALANRAQDIHVSIGGRENQVETGSATMTTDFPVEQPTVGEKHVDSQPATAALGNQAQDCHVLLGAPENHAETRSATMTTDFPVEQPTAREKHVHSQPATAALANRAQECHVSLGGRENQVETGSATMTIDLPFEQPTAREKHVHSQPAMAALANRAQECHVSLGGRENQVETGSATMTTDFPVKQPTAHQKHVHSQPATAALANRAQECHVSLGGRENQVETGSATMTTDFPVKQPTAHQKHVHSQPATAALGNPAQDSPVSLGGRENQVETGSATMTTDFPVEQPTARGKHVHSPPATAALANRAQDSPVSLGGRENQVETGSATMTTDFPVKQPTAHQKHVHSQPATAALGNPAQDSPVSLGGRENQVETGSATMTTDFPVKQPTAREKHITFIAAAANPVREHFEVSAGAREKHTGTGSAAITVVPVVREDHVDNKSATRNAANHDQEEVQSSLERRENHVESQPFAIRTADRLEERANNVENHDQEVAQSSLEGRGDHVESRLAAISRADQLEERANSGYSKAAKNHLGPEATGRTPHNLDEEYFDFPLLATCHNHADTQPFLDMSIASTVEVETVGNEEHVDSDGSDMVLGSPIGAGMSPEVQISGEPHSRPRLDHPEYSDIVTTTVSIETDLGEVSRETKGAGYNENDFQCEATVSARANSTNEKTPGSLRESNVQPSLETGLIHVGIDHVAMETKRQCASATDELAPIGGQTLDGSGHESGAPETVTRASSGSGHEPGAQETVARASAASCPNLAPVDAVSYTEMAVKGDISKPSVKSDTISPGPNQKPSSGVAILPTSNVRGWVAKPMVRPSTAMSTKDATITKGEAAAGVENDMLLVEEPGKGRESQSVGVSAHGRGEPTAKRSAPTEDGKRSRAEQASAIRAMAVEHVVAHGVTRDRATHDYTVKVCRSDGAADNTGGVTSKRVRRPPDRRKLRSRGENSAQFSPTSPKTKSVASEGLSSIAQPTPTIGLPTAAALKLNANRKTERSDSRRSEDPRLAVKRGQSIYAQENVLLELLSTATMRRRSMTTRSRLESNEGLERSETSGRFPAADAASVDSGSLIRRKYGLGRAHGEGLEGRETSTERAKEGAVSAVPENARHETRRAYNEGLARGENSKKIAEMAATSVISENAITRRRETRRMYNEDLASGETSQKMAETRATSVISENAIRRRSETSATVPNEGSQRAGDSTGTTEIAVNEGEVQPQGFTQERPRLTRIRTSRWDIQAKTSPTRGVRCVDSANLDSGITPLQSQAPPVSPPPPPPPPPSPPPPPPPLISDSARQQTPATTASYAMPYVCNYPWAGQSFGAGVNHSASACSGGFWQPTVNPSVSLQYQGLPTGSSQYPQYEEVSGSGAVSGYYPYYGTTSVPQCTYPQMAHESQGCMDAYGNCPSQPAPPCWYPVASISHSADYQYYQGPSNTGFQDPSAGFWR